VHRRRIFSSKVSDRSFESESVRKNTVTLSELLESQKMNTRGAMSKELEKKVDRGKLMSAITAREKSVDRKEVRSAEQIKVIRDLNRTYDKIIGKVINTKAFKRKRYEIKK
jgi:hypothetical protein